MRKDVEIYLKTALQYSSLEPQWRHLEDFSEEGVLQGQSDVLKMEYLAREIITPENQEQILHDFWLGRNRHVINFNKGDYNRQSFEQLILIFHKFAPCEIKVADSGIIFIEK